MSQKPQYVLAWLIVLVRSCQCDSTLASLLDGSHHTGSLLGLGCHSGRVSDDSAILVVFLYHSPILSGLALKGGLLSTYGGPFLLPCKTNPQSGGQSKWGEVYNAI